MRSLISTIAGKGLYIALAITFLWFGGMKFTTYEAEAIKGLLENSPILFVLLKVFSTQAASCLIGLVEVTVAILLLARFVSPKLSALGAVGAVITFLLTLTFFFSTPGVFIGGLQISVTPGQFLLKDIVLLTASIWALNESLNASKN
jgi:uncharacterized membrane protein YkgB